MSALGFVEVARWIACQHGSLHGGACCFLAVVVEEEVTLEIVVVVELVHVVASEPELVLRFNSWALVTVVVEVKLRLSGSSAVSSAHGCMVVVVVVGEEKVEE